MAAQKERTELFGEVDRDVKNRIASEYPAWYFETHLSNMKEERDMLTRRIDRGEIPHDSVPQATAEARAMNERINEIEKSKPELSEKERDDLLKLHAELSNKISESMFTRSEMHMGTAAPHEEARRMVEPRIPLSVPLRGIAKMCNAKIVGSKVSRNDATKVWKIIGRLTGVGTNVEALRRDKATVLTGV